MLLQLKVMNTLQMFTGNDDIVLTEYIIRCQIYDMIWPQQYFKTGLFANYELMNLKLLNV